MPGTILDVKVSVGQSVKKGDVICVLEAMKMENDIPAPADGVIASINVQKGASVAANDLLASLN
jgi:biotin carboxyl carrier protein